jgi:hypothetical protein
MIQIRNVLIKKSKLFAAKVKNHFYVSVVLAPRNVTDVTKQGKTLRVQSFFFPGFSTIYFNP